MSFWSATLLIKGLAQVFLACIFINKEILAQVFSCEFCKISKNTFFTEHLWVTASEGNLQKTTSAFLETVFRGYFRN